MITGMGGGKVEKGFDVHPLLKIVQNQILLMQISLPTLAIKIWMAE